MTFSSKSLPNVPEPATSVIDSTFFGHWRAAGPCGRTAAPRGDPRRTKKKETSDIHLFTTRHFLLVNRFSSNHSKFSIISDMRFEYTFHKSDEPLRRILSEENGFLHSTFGFSRTLAVLGHPTGFFDDSLSRRVHHCRIPAPHWKFKLERGVLCNH